MTPEDETTSDEAFANCQSQVELSLATEPTTVEPTAKIPVENAVNLLFLENNPSLWKKMLSLYCLKQQHKSKQSPKGHSEYTKSISRGQGNWNHWKHLSLSIS